MTSVQCHNYLCKKVTTRSVYIRANQVWRKTQLLWLSGKDFKATFINIVFIKNKVIKIFSKEIKV